MSRTNKPLVITLAVIGSIILVLFLIYSYINGVRNEGIQHERQLTAQYLDNQNYLSGYISGFYEQVNIAQTQNDTLNKILLDTVKGRYEDGGYQINSAFFAAIHEAYPELSLQQLLANWGRIQDYIVAQREGYRNMQSKLLDQLRVYDTWRETDLLRSTVLRAIGFPSSSLEARLGDTVVSGELARNRMYRIVLTGDAVKAYEDGVMDPLEVPIP